MNADERERLMEALTILAEHYQRPLSAGALAFYLNCVDDLPFAAVERALRTLGQTSEFWPMPAKVREIVVGTPSDRALVAWTRLERAMTSAGPYASVTFNDPVLHVTIAQLGGWPLMCEALKLDEREYSFRRRDFLQTYELFARRGHGPAPSRLPGLHEIENNLTRTS